MKSLKTNLIIIVLLVFKSITLTGANPLTSNEDFQGIKPYSLNKWYWQYRGEPIILIGGSDQDNLFQWTGKKLTDQLDLLVSFGGNYVRNTMSDRDEGNSFPFKMTRNNKYDLNQWNDEYWDRLLFFLDETTRRGVIVQLTLWDHFDISAPFRWRVHPWNPENNTNMKSGYWKGDRDFYSTLERNDQEGLKYQQKFVDKLLSITLRYNNVLYNINNESSETPEWENYWAQYIKDAANNARKTVYVTTLQFDAASAVRYVMTNPGLFDFVEISQNNQDSRGGRGKAHWDNLMCFREKIASFGPMPMNNEKIYGSLDGRNYSAGSESEAIDRFWRNIFAGSASARFHRPAEPSAWGSGLNERVQKNLKAMSMLLEELDIFSCTPHNDLLSPRVAVPSTMEAYATANIGKQYAIYFPAGRYTINLDPWVYVKQVKLRWLDIDNLSWSDPEFLEVKWEGGLHDWGYRGAISLETPGNRAYVALIEVVE